MEAVLVLITNPPDLSPRKDDSFADRVNSRYTVIILMVFAVIVSVQLYVGSPITCWAPVHFTDSHKAYTNSYCWIKDTYYLPYEKHIPRPYEDRQYVIYYRWIPFILLGMAILFYFPSVVWHALNQKSGMDADSILSTAQSLTWTDKDTSREGILAMLKNQFIRFLGKPHYKKKAKSPTKWGGYLVTLYLVVRILYLANVLFQFFMLNNVLNAQFASYGFSVMADTAKFSDTYWQDSTYVAFPRVTMCDFNVRRLGNIQRYTVQCTLPLNLYNEKIFLFMWFWMIFVTIIILADFFTWIVRVSAKSDRISYIQSHLEFARIVSTDREMKMAVDFVDDFLKQDGVFLLRLIGHNTNKVTVNEIICTLWETWRERVEAEAEQQLIPTSIGSPDGKVPIDSPDGEEVHV